MSLTWTPAESATPEWTPASDDDLTFTTRGTLSSDAITVPDGTMAFVGAYYPPASDDLTDHLDSIDDAFVGAAQAIIAVGAASIDNDQKGAPNGVAELDGSGLVLSSQLPSYVDDVIVVADFAALPGTGADGKIYVTSDTNLSYRWTGSAYVEISKSLALGTTSSTAHRGDHGSTAYTHSQATGNPHGTTAGDVGAAATSHSHTLANISDAGTLAGLNSVASANITDGTIVAADLAASLLGRIPTTVTVASDVPSPTDGTFTNTTGLAVPVVNGTTYYMVGMLDVTGINAADLRVSLTCPTGEVRLSVQGKNYASTATTADIAYSGEILASGDIVTNLAVITGRSTLVPFQGRFTATADGTLQIQHSQRAANATATTVKAGSYLTYHT